MNLLISQIVAGMVSGAIYACVALAIVMTYQSIRHINLAQGELAMFSTFVAWQFIAWGFNFWVAVLLTVAISFVAGVLLERFAYRPVRDAPGLNQLVMFVGLLAILNSLAGFFWGFSLKTFPSPFPSASFLGLRYIGAQQFGLIAVTSTAMLVLFAFFRFTRIGLAMRAVADNPISSRLVGIRIDRVVGLGWGISAALGAIAGVLVAPIVFLEPNMMMGVLLYSFTAAVVGGLESPVGALVGGFIVGIVENIIGAFVPVIGGELKFSIALAIILLVLIARPDGLFNRKIVERV